MKYGYDISHAISFDAAGFIIHVIIIKVISYGRRVL